MPKSSSPSDTDLPPVPVAWQRQPVKGRGTAWDLAHRFHTDQREAYDDGWGNWDQQAQQAWLPPRTQVIEEQVKSILSSNHSPDIPFNLSINPYRGCEHVITRQSVCD
jgi:hypothetical protein